MSRADAFGKVNLSLLVGGRRSDGLHPIRSLTQSIDWPDHLVLEGAEEDSLVVDDPDLSDRGQNLAWRAVEAVREASRSPRPVSLTLEKRIPVAAGLGGGSADAAAALRLAGTLFGAAPGDLEGLAPDLGADVAFCLFGGTALVEGAGERLTALPALDAGFLAVVVPPFPLDTAAVYGRWDELGGPQGDGVAGRDLPPALRRIDEPIRNDLTPAAVAVEPRLGDWIADTTRTWGLPALMSGSGPALFGHFPTPSEAVDAVAAISGARAGRACRPVGFGVRIVDEDGEAGRRR
jgi:4-diphosphocytidyl-2-C-methyl-D-erythritol kinase